VARHGLLPRLKLISQLNIFMMVFVMETDLSLLQVPKGALDPAQAGSADIARVMISLVILLILF
jgi:hypothetical protein